jgi:hypothetical protein
LDLQAVVHLPRRYDLIAGVGVGHLFQVQPGSAADQTRVAALLGYSDLPEPGASPLGFETSLHLGGFRGSSGPLVRGGGLALASVSALIRLSPSRPSWQSDDISQLILVLVPFVRAGCLISFDDFTAQSEVSGGLAIRVYLWSGLLP